MNDAENIEQQPNDATSSVPKPPAKEPSYAVDNANNASQITPEIQAMIDKITTQQLAEIKQSLNEAYSTRDEALKKAAAYEQQQKEATMKRLEEEGKFKEAYEMKLAEEKARIAVLEQRNTELTRDNVVRDNLRGLDFRNKKAADLAFREVVAELVQDDAGNWMHKSGKSIADFIDAFTKDEEQSFLFKPKTNSGAGLSQPSSTVPSSTKRSLLEMSQEEVLAMAARGEFGNLNRF